MRVGEVEALIVLSREPMTIKEISKKTGHSYTRTTEIVKSLAERGLVTKANGRVSLANTVHATLFRRLNSRFDMTKLIGGKREDVAIALLSTGDTRDIQEFTGYSYRTIRRALVRMMETGAVKWLEGRYELESDRDLSLFLTSLKEYTDRLSVEPYADVIHVSNESVLKKVPSGKAAQGHPTAFSAFHLYGVEIRPVEDYYIQQSDKPSIEEVLIHAIISSTGPVELTDCAILLRKNIDKIDLGKARNLARKFKVETKLLDLENYIRNLTISSPKILLPWNEFTEKARMYGVVPEALLPPEAYPNFFWLVGEKLENVLEVYLFGGESMRMKGLKRATKDVDVALRDESAFKNIRKALINLDYRQLDAEEMSPADKRLEPSGIFVKERHPRVDVFTHRICGEFILTEQMLRRSSTVEMGKLKLLVAGNEDLFLLKAITEREGDIHDMTALARTQGFNWTIVFDELLNQEEITEKQYCLDILESVEVVENLTGIRAPVRNRLINHCLDQAIIKIADRIESFSARQIRNLVNYPEYRIESRIRRLVKQGELFSLSDGRYSKC